MESVDRDNSGGLKQAHSLGDAILCLRPLRESGPSVRMPEAYWGYSVTVGSTGFTDPSFSPVHEFEQLLWTRLSTRGFMERWILAFGLTTLQELER